MTTNDVGRDKSGPAEPSNPEFVKDVEDRLWDLCVLERAKRLKAARDWVVPTDQGDLNYQIENPESETAWIVEQLMPPGLMQVNAQYKTGKTTLMVNLAKSLATGDAFLGKFPVHVGPEERIGYWNFELNKQTLVDWFADTGMRPEARARIVPLHLRGNRAIDFNNDLAVEWAIKWLVENGIRIWIIDPLSKLYHGGENDNDSFNQWWMTLEDIARQANLRGVVIAHHTGHGEDTADRARGASAMMGNPDVNVTFRHDGPVGGLPMSTKRYLRAFGRDVDVPEMPVGYHAPTRELFATGGGNRTEAEAEREAARARAEVLRCASGGIRPNKQELFDRLGWKLTGRQKPKYEQFYDLAKQRDYIRVALVGKSILHDPGEHGPERRLKLVQDAETNDGEPS